MKNRTWILIRGLARESRHWMDFPGLLETCFPGDQVLTPDLPGFGKAFDHPSPWNLADITTHVRKQVPDLEASNFHLIGVSLGGMVALDWMLRFPDEVQATVILNSSASSLSFPTRRVRPPALWSFLMWSLLFSAEKKEREILSLVSNREDIRRKFLPHWARFQNEKPARRREAFKQFVAAARFSPDLDDLVGNRLLFLTSYADRLCHWSCTSKLASFLQAPMHVNSDAGHDLTADAPDWVLQHITSWMID